MITCGLQPSTYRVNGRLARDFSRLANPFHVRGTPHPDVSGCATTFQGRASDIERIVPLPNLVLI